MKKVFLTAILGLLLSGNAFAQSSISVWGEDFRDKSGLAVMIHMKAADTSICFKDVKIKTNIGEDSMQSFGCDADNLENYFMIYPGEDDDISTVTISSLRGVNEKGRGVDIAKLLTPIKPTPETSVRVLVQAKMKYSPRFYYEGYVTSYKKDGQNWMKITDRHGRGEYVIHFDSFPDKFRPCFTEAVELGAPVSFSASTIDNGDGTTSWNLVGMSCKVMVTTAKGHIAESPNEGRGLFQTEDPAKMGRVIGYEFDLSNKDIASALSRQCRGEGDVCEIQFVSFDNNLIDKIRL